jgi:hypothetical protein
VLPPISRAQQGRSLDVLILGIGILQVVALFLLVDLLLYVAAAAAVIVIISKLFIL